MSWKIDIGLLVTGDDPKHMISEQDARNIVQNTCKFMSHETVVLYFDFNFTEIYCEGYTLKSVSLFRLSPDVIGQ